MSKAAAVGDGTPQTGELTTPEASPPQPEDWFPVHRTLIDGACKSKALQFLAESLAITASAIFPDVVGLGRFLRWQFDSLRTIRRSGRGGGNRRASGGSGGDLRQPLWSNLGYTGQSTGSLLAHVRGRRNRADDIGRHQLLPLSSPHTTSSAGTPVNQQVRRIADLGRVIHEPGRLMIVTLLYAVERTNFVPAARNGYEQRYALQSYFPARGGSLCRRGENLSGEGATDALTSDHSRPQSV